MKLLSEFAARWRKELDPESVRGGRQARKLYSIFDKEDKLLPPVPSDEQLAKSYRRENEFDEKKNKVKKASNDKRKSFKFLEPTQENSNRKQRIKELKTLQGNKSKTSQLIKTEYPKSSKKYNNIYKQLSSTPFKSKPKIASGTIYTPKVISSVISPTNNNNARQALQSAGKSGMKKQLLAATAIGGVIGGIALARKTRSDKNKKRGKYKLL